MKPEFYVNTLGGLTVTLLDHPALPRIICRRDETGYSPYWNHDQAACLTFGLTRRQAVRFAKEIMVDRYAEEVTTDVDA